MIEEALQMLQRYKTEDKDLFFMSCLKQRLDKCLKEYENSTNEALKHLLLYRKDVVVLTKYSRGEKR